MTSYTEFVDIIKSVMVPEGAMEVSEKREYGVAANNWMLTLDKEIMIKNEFRNIWVIDINASSCIIYKGANVDGKDVIPSVMLCFNNVMYNSWAGIVRTDGIKRMKSTNPIGGVCTIKTVPKTIIVEPRVVVSGLHIIESPRMLVVPVIHRGYVPIISVPGRVEMLVRSGATLGDLARLRGFL